MAVLSAFRHLPRLAGLLVGAYVVSTAGLLALGRSPASPAGLMLYLVVVVLPLAVSIVGAAVVVERTGWGPTTWAASLVVGVLLVVTFRSPLAWFAPAAITCWLLRRELLTRHTASTSAVASVTVAAGYGTVWNGNILAAIGAPTVTMDAVLMQADVWLYEQLGLAQGYRGVYPIVRAPWVFAMLESGYLLAFPLLLVVLVYFVLREPNRLGPALAGLFTAYAFALIVFAVFPTAGPCIVFPDSLDQAYRQTETGTLMTSMASSFDSVRLMGATPEVAYFVALPSLHVVVGLYLPLLVRRCRPLFWMLVPAGVLVVLSTFLLGYHYVLDAFAAIPVVWAALRIARPTDGGDPPASQQRDGTGRASLRSATTGDAPIAGHSPVGPADHTTAYC